MLRVQRAEHEATSLSISRYLPIRLVLCVLKSVRWLSLVNVSTRQSVQVVSNECVGRTSDATQLLRLEKRRINIVFIFV